MRPLTRKALDEVGGWARFTLGFARIFEQRCVTRSYFGRERSVHDHGHFQIDGSRPETIVVLRGIAPAARKRAKPYSFETHPLAALHFDDILGNTDIRQHSNTDQPVTIDGAVLFGEIIVESLNDRDQSLIVANRRIAHVESKQNLGVNAVPVLLAQPLLCTAASWRTVVIENRRIEVFRWSAAEKTRTTVNQWFALQQQAIATVAESHPARRPITIRLGHPMCPLLGRRLEVTVCRDVAIISRHKMPSLKLASLT